MIFRWNYIYSDFYINDEDNNKIWAHEEHSFFNIYKNSPPRFGLLRMKYDGVPYKILALKIFAISWGHSGLWAPLPDKPLKLISNLKEINEPL